MHEKILSSQTMKMFHSLNQLSHIPQYHSFIYFNYVLIPPWSWIIIIGDKIFLIFKYHSNLLIFNLMNYLWPWKWWIIFYILLRTWMFCITNKWWSLPFLKSQYDLIILFLTFNLSNKIFLIQFFRLYYMFQALAYF